jgi:hypothetical protein
MTRAHPGKSAEEERDGKKFKKSYSENLFRESSPSWTAGWASGLCSLILGNPPGFSLGNPEKPPTQSRLQTRRAKRKKKIPSGLVIEVLPGGVEYFRVHIK